ncbi:hypothetical protein ACQ4PT_014651 [Festuca glaucescens]
MGALCFGMGDLLHASITVSSSPDVQSYEPAASKISDVFRNVVGIVGNVISFGLFLAPVQTFWKIVKKDVEEFSADPYLATLLNCLLWVFYGLPLVHPNSMLVVTINRIGLVIEAIYLIIYLVHAPNKKRLRVLAVLGIEGISSGPTQIGDLNEYMPLFLSLVGLANRICWTTYALIKFDVYITIPNGLGILLSLVQLILYGCYYKSTPKKEKNVELPTVLTKANSTVSDGRDISIAVEK